MPATCERGRGEQGVFLVLWALLLLGLMTMVAIVLDLGALRADRREQRAAADAASAAGANELSNGAVAACNAAWQYALRNLDVTAGSSPCSGFPTCAAGASHSVTGNAGPYSITITHPVVNGDDLLLADAVGPDLPQGTSAEADGAACERIGVRISSTRKAVFARVIGNLGNTTAAHSVARFGPGGPADEPASLVLLERHDCRAGRTEGVNTRLVVAAANGTSGKIQADSRGDGSCPGAAARVLEGTSGPVGSPAPSILTQHFRDGSGTIIAQARIGIFAKSFGSANAHSAWPTTIGEPNPVGFKQAGRTPVDERFLENVRDLETTATLDVDDVDGPLGYINATDPAPFGMGLGCTIDTAVPITSALGSKFWFNCPGGLTVRNLTITSTDAEVVVAGPLTVTSTGFFIHDARKVWVRGKSTGNNRGIDVTAPFVVNNGNLATCSARFTSARTRVGTLFVKEGVLSATSARVQWCQTHVYLRGASSFMAASALPAAVTPPPALPPAPGDYGSIGTVNVLGLSTVDWTAPNVLDTRPTATDLAVHRFEDLALWSEAHGASRLNGGGGMTLGGIFFLPNADPFTIAGNSGQSITVDAQFYVRKLTVTGGSTLRMVPNPANQVPIESGSVSLIR